MRFEELVIEKYGSCHSLTLRFPESPGLVVIYGPNEAGKSTCLAAISDFLFGIPNQSAYGQLFGNDQMRLCATLRRRSGERLLLRRRKGRTRTLTDGDGKVVDDNVLGALLGTTDRARFGSLFGLNHESLREGGKRLLAAEGDVGRLIVEAGGGLRALVDQVAALEREADQLFAPRKSAERAFYQALAAFETAEKAVRDGLVTREDYEQARRDHEDARLALERLKQAQRALYERRLQQERLVRVTPLLAELDKAEAHLSTFATLPSLRRPFAQEVRDALARRRQTQQAFDEAEKQRASLALQIEGLVAPPELLAAEAQLRDIIEKAKALVRQRADRPNREKELAALEAKLAPLRRIISVAADAELESRMPSSDAIADVQRLAAQGIELRPQIQGLEAQLADDAEAIAGLEARQQERAQAGQDQPFGVPAGELDGLPKQAAALDARRAQVERGEQEIGRRRGELGFETVDALRRLTCPDAAVIQGELDARAALEAERVKLAATLTMETARRDGALRELDRLRRGGEVPTEAAIHSVRRERQAAWQPIRSAYLAADTQALLALPPGERGGAVERLEKRIDEADDLADRRSTEAQRIASLAIAEKQRDEADAAITAAKTATADLEGKLAQARQRWEATWTDAARIEGDLGRLKEFAQKRQELLALVAGSEAARAEVEQLQAEINARLEALALAEQQLGLSPAPSAQLAARTRIVNQRIAAHDEAYRSHRDDASRLVSLRAQHKKRRAQLAALIQTEAAWQEAWKRAAPQLGLGEQASPARANEVATAWAAASGTFDGIRITRRRLERMDDDEDELRRKLAAVAAGIGLKLADDPVAAAHMIEERWSAAARLVSERATLMPELEKRTHERDARQEELRLAEETIRSLCDEARCTVGELAGLGERHAEWTAAEDALRQLRDKVFSAGDGQAVEQLRERLGGRGLDELQAELVQLKADAERLETELADAAVRVEACKSRLGQFQSAEGYNQAVAARERAAAELHQVVERYVELRLARTLLSTGLGWVREQQQDPLVKRAGELFVLTTGGAFTAVETDVDGRGHPVVVGKRGDGSTVSIDMMSDGTRDQLFLSFRIAHIEQYCASTEPLPFIADDLLVHFDDGRSGTTLELLAELGKSTQILLFTHHRSVRELALGLAQTGRAGFVDLSPDGRLAAA